MIHSSASTWEMTATLEQAFVDLNIPVGNGLKVIIGKTVTLMGVEVIEETANPNWSEGKPIPLRGELHANRRPAGL